MQMMRPLYGKRCFKKPTTDTARSHQFQLKEHIYALTPESSLLIGKRNEGHVSNYYFGEVIDDKEVADLQIAAEKHGIDILNTR